MLLGLASRVHNHTEYYIQWYISTPLKRIPSKKTQWQRGSTTIETLGFFILDSSTISIDLHEIIEWVLLGEDDCCFRKSLSIHTHTPTMSLKALHKLCMVLVAYYYTAVSRPKNIFPRDTMESLLFLSLTTRTTQHYRYVLILCNKTVRVQDEKQ